MKALITLALSLSVAACALPTSTTTSGSARPTLLVKGAPAGAILVVDGTAVGAAADFDGRSKVLALEEGAHRIEVRQGTAVIVQRSVFGSGGERISIDVGGGQ
jgi:hypothetical protein